MRHDSISNLRTRKLSQYPFQSIAKALANSAVFSLLIILMGCASVSKTPQLTSSKSDVSLGRIDMVSDLLSVLPQIMEPLTTTIQISESESGEFVDAAAVLVELGYGVQRVDADQGSHFLYIAQLPNADNSGPMQTRLRISIADLELTRSYTTISNNANSNISGSVKVVWRDNKAVVPTSPLIVAGTRQSIKLSAINVELVGGGIGEKPYEFASGRVQYAALAPIEGGVPTISLITDDAVQRLASSAVPSPASLNSTNNLSGTVFNGDSSAFASILDDYDRIAREFVIFPHDSKNLGRPGKTIVKKLVSRYSDNSDIVGIIGCTNGPTALETENEGLALARANRIVEELIIAGVSPDKVYDEGCWSPTTDAEGFPNRGVVLDLWRRAS